MADPPKKPGGGMSLYAHLLEPKSSSATISGAPVLYDAPKSEEASNASTKKKDAPLMFQPIKRPQAANKPKPKHPSAIHRTSSSSVAPLDASSSPDKQVHAASTQGQPSFQTSKFEEWLGDDEEGFYYQEQQRRERAGRKKRKKNNSNNNKPQQETYVWDWDDIYDPSRPNKYADYKNSEEETRAIRDWKDLLYREHIKRAKKAYTEKAHTQRPNPTFAPPTNLTFAPPPSFSEPSHGRSNIGGAEPLNFDVESSSFAPPAATHDRIPSVPEVSTGEDAYERRMRLSGMQFQASSDEVPPPPPPPEITEAPHGLQPTSSSEVQPGSSANLETGVPLSEVERKRAEVKAKLAQMQAKIAAQKAGMVSGVGSESLPPDAPPPPPLQEDPIPTGPVIRGATISAAPVRYDVEAPSATGEVDTAKADQDPGTIASSNRPSKKDFGQRMLKKYGWTKGEGLGRNKDGITTALSVKAEKRKRRPDAEGGGWRMPVMGENKILGGKRRKIDTTEDDDGAFGALSYVIRLKDMLAGLDVEYEVMEGGLMQDIGDDMSRYGTIERLFIWRQDMGGNDEVFIKFASQLSALRAVNEKDDMTFSGNKVKASFYPLDKFEAGEYA